jgi:hypothetical protein
VTLVFLYGLPATGKLTVAQELSKITGYKVFHNHLVVDLLLSTFDFGSPPFIELREKIWLSVFDQACCSQLPGLIFTFNPENTVRESFLSETIETVRRSGGQVKFVELICDLIELKRRIDSPSRLQYKKLNSLPLFEKLHADGVFDAPRMPKAHVRVDTVLHSPADAAAMIREALTLNES